MARTKHKARRSKKRRRSRSKGVDKNDVDRLKALGFSHEQIDSVHTAVAHAENPFDAALEILLADNNQANNHNLMDGNEAMLREPLKKRRKIQIDSEDETLVTNSNNSNNSNHVPHEAKKKTQLEIKEEQFNERKEEMEQHENEYKQWEERQVSVANVLHEIRDHIHDLYEKRPQIQDNNAQEMKMDDLLTERIQLKTIIDYAYDAIEKHMNLCNKRIDDQFVMKENKKQDIENERFKYEKSKQEFESEKYALQLMETEVKSGKNVMTLVERNLFIVASAMNNNPENVDNEHFKSLTEKIKILQNKGDINENTNSSKEENEDVAFECGICFVGRSDLSEIMIFDECYHFYCMECLKHYLKTKLEDRNVKNISCPCDKCEHKLDHTEISYILTKEQYAKFDEYLLDKTLQSAEDCRFCPAVDCGAAMFGYSDSPMLTCPKCQKQFCFNCGTEEWHRGVTCAAFKKWKEENGKADVKFDEWVKSQNAKQCPQCNSFIQKNGGCDHMTCRNCKYEFHWQTMEKWKGYGVQYDVPQNRGVRGRVRDVFNDFNWMDINGYGNAAFQWRGPWDNDNGNNNNNNNNNNNVNNPFLNPLFGAFQF